QVSFHVHSQRLKRRDVEYPAAMRPPIGRRMKHEAVEAPEKCGKRFAATGRRQNQRALSACNGRPAEPLRRGGCIENGAKPGCRDRMEAVERIGDGIWDGV